MDGSAGEQKVVAALVGRLVNKLPCNSGIRLGMMELDPGVQTTIQSILQMAKIRLSLVVFAVTGALEALSKYSSSSSLSETSLDTLHSQAFLLQLLQLSLSSSWETQTPPSPSQTGLPRCWPDPKPFDDSLARHVLAVVMIYSRMMSGDIPGLRSATASPVPSSRGGTPTAVSKDKPLLPASSSYALGTQFLQQHSYPSARAADPTLRLSSACSTISSTISEVLKYTSRIVFYLSASNWTLVLARFKTRISYLTTTAEESPDISDLRLLEWANVDRLRLAQILQEISTVFLHIKKPVQVALAIILRKAIWNWIQVHPTEYESLVESNRKLEGGAEGLFDILTSMSDVSTSNARRVKAFYPLMAMLLVICPDTLKKTVMGDSTSSRKGSGFAKKSQYMEHLRKGITAGNKAFEACVISYVDFIRAAMCLSPRLDGSGVRSLVPEIQNDLKTALFFSSLSSEIVDQSVLVAGLIALYRADPTTITSTVFPKLWSDASEANRIIGVRACTTMVNEGERLPWHPPVSVLREATAAAIREILKSQTTMLLREKRPRASLDLPTAQTDLIWEVLKLYSADADFAGVEQILAITASLTVVPSPKSLRTAASKTNAILLGSLIDKDMGASAPGVWQVLIDISRQALLAFHAGDSDDLGTAADAFRETILAVLRLAEAKPEHLAATPNAKSAVLLASIAALTGLIGPDVEQSSLASPALLALSRLTFIVYGPVDQSNGPIVEEVAAQAQLMAELANLPPATGRQQQQRQIRRVARAHFRSSIPLVATWLGLAARANSLTSRIVRADHDELNERDSRRKALAADIEGLDEDQSKEWQNLISFLCSTANVCQYETTPPKGLADFVSKGLLPKVYEQEQDPLPAVESFIKQCVDLLISNSIHVRETVKEALGAELPPSLLRVLIQQMSRLMSLSVGPSGITTSDSFTVFVEQAITVLRLSVERIEKGDSAGGLHLDLAEFIFLLAQYIYRLGRDDLSLRIKIKFCQLTGMVLGKHEAAILSNNVRYRNAVFEWIGEWTLESIRDSESHSLTREGSIKLQRELDLACLKALVPLSEGLVLRSQGDDAEETQTVVKSRLFYRQYQLFVKVLERAKFSPQVVSVHYTPSIGGPTASNPAQQISDQAGTLAIMALSNLLAANVDVGLKHCLALSHHEDPALRTCFMQLLTNILQQGTRFNGLSATRSSSTPKLYLDCLTAPNLAFALAICESVPPGEVDEISLLLFRVFEAHGSLLALLKVLIEKEVAQTNHESELFRANSITTRILTIFAKTYGYNYVRATLQPLIHSLVEKPADCSFELDPSKASETDDITRNADHLKLMCQALLDIICSSTPRVPVLFRALCHHIWEVVEDRFPDSKHSAVGSFIFLRFFCPAIVAPEGIDLDLNPDTREIRRALLFITKVIQNLANNVVFGSKEPHMKVLNQFLSENIRQVTKFLSDVAIRPRSWELAAASKAFQEDGDRSRDAEGDDAVLHRFTFRHLEKLETSLKGLPVSFSTHSTSSRSSRTELDGKSALEYVKRITEESGPPTDTARLSASARNQAYDEFMRHNQGRNVEPVMNVFYEGPASQNGRRIFYFIVSRVALVDYDLLAYHVFQILDKITDFFDLVIDVTNFSPATELPVAWLRRSLQMCPPGILPCLNTLALYNPNTYARKRLRRVISELMVTGEYSACPVVRWTHYEPGPGAGKFIVAASSPAELAEFIPFTSLALPEYTMALAYEADHVFTNLLCLSDHEMQVPVVLKLGHDCLQIASWRKQDLTSSLKAYIIDVIHLRDIDDIVAGTGLTSDHLVVKHSQTESVTFISRRRNEMAQIIRAARARLRDTPSEERALRPSDVPATLLNVALLNLSADDELLRMGAYNLLVELSQFFRYDLSNRITKVTGLFIPNNSLAFIFDLSKSLATSAPHLTLEFLKEWAIGFAKADTPQKTACLYYVAPWLANLEAYSRPSREDGTDSTKQVGEIVRSLISLTVSERREHVWSVLGDGHEALIDIVVDELLHSAVDAGMGSEKAECAADTLVSLGSTTVRGKVIARLRKTIAQTYLKPSAVLVENVAWNEICALARANLTLAFSPQSALDTQLFLPELFHIVTLLLGSGPVLMRQTVYGLVVNILQSLASAASNGDTDSSALQRLLKRIQQADLIAAFGLVQQPGSLELVGGLHKDETDVALLVSVEEVSKFLGDVLIAGAVSIGASSIIDQWLTSDCANAWRARWMGLVAATCFQHNPATQPQAFTVLGDLAQDEVDDDLVYQILVAMSTTLTQFAEDDNVLIISMLRCLSRIIPGLLPDSRYASTLFWLAVGVLQLGYIPLFAAALELMLTALKSMGESGALSRGLSAALLESRKEVGEEARKLDQVCGVSFETDVCFALVAIVFKGVRHPSTRKLAIDTLMELLKRSPKATSDEQGPMVDNKSVAFFTCLLPVVAGSTAEMKELFHAAGLQVGEQSLGNLGELSVFDLLMIPDNSTALLLVTLVVTMIGSATSDVEKLILYRFLAEASIEMPEVVAMAYDSLVPRMTAVLATTANKDILSAVTVTLERAMSDPTYTFPSMPPTSDSTTSLHHQTSYSASISSIPSMGMGAREQVLDDLGMKGLGELSFPSAKMERIVPMAKWVALLIESLTV
ncbi:neurofibromin 1, partial [Tremellales sp. Uapishka_1]